MANHQCDVYYAPINVKTPPPPPVRGGWGSAAEEVVDMRGGWADPDLFL